MKLFNQIIPICALFLLTSMQSIAQDVNWKKVKVLVYTKNGKGYVHDNIPNAVACIQKLGRENNFKVDTSSDASVMTGDNLRQYTMLIFASTNNDVFDTDAQRLAFRKYIESGGGFVGIHSVTGTERNWKWFKKYDGRNICMASKVSEVQGKDFRSITSFTKRSAKRMGERR